MDRIKELTEEKVQLKNLMRHLDVMRDEFYITQHAYNRALRLMQDTLVKINDKLFYANNKLEIYRDQAHFEHALGMHIDTQNDIKRGK